ncbi:MAG: helix-turn-helix domain-containing protein [Thermoleophilia bacterium]|nr:helix-turn-helix domain-containing protein [Thermoleophilia bacterium]
MPRSLTTHIDSPKEVGVRLKAARERAGLSQRQLAFPGCTAAYISRIEAGARVPSLQMINQLALRLEVSGQWLATGVEVAHAEPSELLDAEVALRLGEIEEAERIYRGHLEHGDPARPAALAGLGQIAFRSERWVAAIELLDQAFDLRGRSALADPGAVDTLGRAHAITGSRESAIALFERAAAEAHEAGASVEELRFAVLLANALIDAGEFSKAEACLAEVIRFADAAGDPVASARVFWSQSRLHSMRHEPRLAGRYARRALEILERTENDSYVGMAYHLLAHAELESGDGVEALRLLGRGRALFGRELGPADDARFSLEEARALMSLGRHSEAALKAARTLELLDSVSPGDRGHAYVTLADVFLAAGDRARARMLLEQALDLLTEYLRPMVLEAGRRLATLLEEDGDTAGALQVLKRATDAASSVPAGQRA